jgi:hypothetical protein
MKALKSTQTRINQTNNNSLALKNQKVMKTKKYSISMKALAALVFAFTFSAFLNAQGFETPAPGSNTQVPAEEVRATVTVTYDLFANHTDLDEYRWVVLGGTITGGTPVAPDSSVLDWTVNAFSIDVTWDTDITGDAIGSAPGEIFVQKRAGGTCASELQVLDITMWNPATANFDLTGLVAGICSGEALGFTVPVDLTGSPDPVVTNFGFDVDWEYEVTAGTLTDLGAAPVDGVTGTAVSNTDLAQIPLPNGLLNTGAGDATFVVRLTAMQDDFNVVGVVGATFEYQFTVYATPATGDINSSISLTR